MTAKRKAEPAKHLDTAQRILAAAEMLFAEHGFDAVSMNAIAVQAKVSKANVFHHFSSKNALHLAVIKNACRRSEALIEELGQDATPITERLAEFARTHLRHLIEREQVVRLITRELLKGGPRRAQELAQQAFGDNFAKFVDALRRSQANGELRADIDPAIIAVLIIGADLFFLQNQHVLRHFPDVDFAEAPDAFSAKLTELLLNGVLPCSPAREPLCSKKK